MATYTELVGSGTTPGIIRDWANRDTAVLPQTVVNRCITWAADICYKKLQIPPLEETLTFTIEASDLSTLEDGSMLLTMPIPEDMIEPIFLRRASDSTVFNARVDRRTIYDADADRIVNSFTQVGNNYVLFGRFEASQVIELHYYRRLPAMDATYIANAANYNSGGGVGNVADGRYLRTATATDTDPTTLYLVGSTAYDTQAAAEAVGSFTRISVVGNEVAHWLRDENERILVYGALVEIFTYLDEGDTQARYKALFEEEIARLNEQQNRRFAMGGNVQVSYTGRGLL